MSAADDVAWQAAVNAAGSTPVRLHAAERVLASVGDEVLSTDLVDHLVAQAIAARVPPAPRPRLRPAHGVIAVVALLATLAAVGPQWIWPERMAATRSLDCEGALSGAMTGADDAERLRAVTVLDDYSFHAIKLLRGLTDDPDPQLATTGAIGLARISSALLGVTRPGETGTDFARSQAIALDPSRSAGDRVLAAHQVANWGAYAIHAMRSAVLLDAEAGKKRQAWLTSLSHLLPAK